MEVPPAGKARSRSERTQRHAIPAKRKQPADDQVSPSSQQSRWEREDPDVRLMLRFQGGDADAFDELVRRNTTRTHAIISRFIHDPHQVEDLTQEVFLRIYKTAKRYRPKAKFSTWLYRIAANLSFNAIRARHAAPTMSLEARNVGLDETFSRETPDRRTESVDASLRNQELRRQIARAVNALPHNQKIAIILNKYEGSSYREIAKVLNCSPIAVKSLLSRARRSLQGMLARYIRNE